ncbi:MAG: OmpA family protein [Kofleriaceae bacterium]|nr:OmpA family protein [Kofleriaceae bacterium]
MKFSKIVAATTLLVGSGVASAQQADDVDVTVDVDTDDDTMKQNQDLAQSGDQQSGRMGEKAIKKDAQAGSPTENKRACKAAEVFFKFDSAALNSDDTAVLQRLVDEVNRYEGTTIVLDGFTDPRGSEAYNIVLSGKRADAVRQKLVALGAPEDRIVLGLHGKTGERRDSYPEDRRVTAWITRNTTKQIVNHELENGAHALVWGDQMKTIAVLGGEGGQREEVEIEQEPNQPGEG